MQSDLIDWRNMIIQSAMEFVKLLCSMHMQQTFSGSPPFAHTVDLTGCAAPKTDTEYQTLLKAAYDEYKTGNRPYGSVDYGTSCWAAVAVAAVKEGKNVLPNGCCSQKSCYINVFYDIMIKHMKIPPVSN